MTIKLKNKNSLNGGYTFIELIVVISIFSIITSVVLFNSGNFTSGVSLQNTTSDIALQIKEAQSDAIAGRLNENLNQVVNTLGVQYFRPIYGIRFEKGNQEFTKFTDLPLPGSFTWVFDDLFPGSCNSDVPECMKKIKINGFDSISDIKVGSIGDSPSDYVSVDILDISFQRPFPDAIITAEEDGNTVYNNAEIIITSSRAGERKIIINSVGNISTESVTP